MSHFIYATLIAVAIVMVIIGSVATIQDQMDFMAECTQTRERDECETLWWDTEPQQTMPVGGQ